MSYPIDSRKVAGVVVECNAALEGKGFNDGEVLVGLAELVGRVIANTNTTPSQMDELQKVVSDHVARTVRIGAHALGKSNIARA